MSEFDEANEDSIPLELQQKGLYTSLLRFLPEAGSLRDRALDQIVLIALRGASEEAPFDLNTIQSNCAVGMTALRHQVLRSTLTRLVDKKKIVASGDEEYYLLRSGTKDLNRLINSSSDVFKPVLQKLLKNISGTCTPAVAETVFRGFISACFESFGQQIAKAVIGNISRAELLNVVDVDRMFSKSVKGLSLDANARNSLRTRCVAFLKSREPSDEVLKFRLTQGFFIYQLTGIESEEFNPIVEDTFKGSVFYLDTNVILGRLDSLEFRELVALAKGVGIELRITEATIAEAQEVVTRKTRDLDAIVDVIPENFIHKTKDDFVKSFLEQQRKNPNLTVEEFGNSQLNLHKSISDAGIFIESLNTDQILEGMDVSDQCALIDEAAEMTRGWGKSEAVQLHDVAHFILIRKCRGNNVRAWFLTRDRTLSTADTYLSDGGLPFCYPLASFIQSVSPFVESDQQQNSLSELFSDLLSNNIRGIADNELFDLSELKLISELHDDVLSTPPEELASAFDFIKTDVIGSGKYTEKDHNLVALELKKYLASNTDEKIQALQAQVTKQTATIQESDRSFKLLEESFTDVQNQLVDLRAKLEDGRNTATNLRLVVLFLGVLVTVFFWSFPSDILAVYSSHITEVNNTTIVRLIGSGILVLTALPYCSKLETPINNILVSLFVLIALLGSGDFNRVTEFLAPFFGIALTVGVILVQLFHRKEET